MATIFALTRKAVWLIHLAIEERITSEEARYRREDSQADAAGDYGNDLTHLKLWRDAFAAKRGDHSTAKLYECWSDPSDGGITLTRFEDVHRLRDQGQLGEGATRLYSIVAESWEEAQAIHHLRQGWAPYVPMGEAAPCPQCATPYYPWGSGDCWRCGHIDESPQNTEAQQEAVTRRKSIRQVIAELHSFEDQDLEVRLSLNSGFSHKPVTVLTKRDGFCVLENCER